MPDTGSRSPIFSLVKAASGPEHESSSCLPLLAILQLNRVWGASCCIFEPARPCVGKFGSWHLQRPIEDSKLGSGGDPLGV
mmetsp:Transcript_35584/g.111036  ORF Transcript_35584/g.111036 Transcript_35584/m.111036 type:complete len:81 (-) Transcript_35584:85-327(-)